MAGVQDFELFAQWAAEDGENSPPRVTPLTTVTEDPVHTEVAGSRFQVDRDDRAASGDRTTLLNSPTPLPEKPGERGRSVEGDPSERKKHKSQSHSRGRTPKIDLLGLTEEERRAF